MYQERKESQDFISSRWWLDWCISQALFNLIKYSQRYWLVFQEYSQVSKFFIKNSQCQLFDWLSLNLSICYLNPIHCHWFDWRIRIVGCYCCSIYRPACTKCRTSSHGYGCSFCHYCYHTTLLPQRDFQRQG